LNIGTCTVDKETGPTSLPLLVILTVDVKITYLYQFVSTSDTYCRCKDNLPLPVCRC